MSENESSPEKGGDHQWDKLQRAMKLNHLVSINNRDSVSSYLGSPEKRNQYQVPVGEKMEQVDWVNAAILKTAKVSYKNLTIFRWPQDFDTETFKNQQWVVRS